MYHLSHFIVWNLPDTSIVIHADFCYDNYDCSYEAYLWLDNTGHGTNGAPYDMKDVYEDMEACEKMIFELWESLSGKDWEEYYEY